MKGKLTDLQEMTLVNIKNDIGNHRDMSIRECADRNFVSIGFLSKLAQKLGYKGYSEMVFYLSSKRFETAESDNKQAHQHILNYSEELQNRFDEMLESVNRGYIYCSGTGYSMIVVDYICRKASKNGFRTLYTEAFGELVREDEKPLMIAVSYSGETSEVIKSMELCHNFRIPTIVFTRNERSRAARLADLLVIVNKMDNEEELGINSFVGMAINCFELLSANVMKKQ